MNYQTGTSRGIYTLQNPQKYFGTKNPVYKSSWEQRMFYIMDVNPKILKWGYECQQIPYFNPAKQQMSVYFPDIFCHVLQANGTERQFLIEVKPHKMCFPPPEPKVPKKNTPTAIQRYQKQKNRYLQDCVNYQINVSKWQYAKAWCDRHNILWVLATEKNLPMFLN